MGKAGRFACILTPMLLTLASLVCIVLVMIGQMSTGGNKAPSTSLGRSLYFFKVRLTYISPPTFPHATNNSTRQTPATSATSPTSSTTSTSTTSSSTPSKAKPPPASSKTSTKSACGPTARAQRTRTRAKRLLLSARPPSPTSGSIPSRSGTSRTLLRRMSLAATSSRRGSTHTRRCQAG